MHYNTSHTSNTQTQDLSTDFFINNTNNSKFNTEICNPNNLGIFFFFKTFKTTIVQMNGFQILV